MAVVRRELDGTGTRERLIVEWISDAAGAVRVCFDGVEYPLLTGRPVVLKTIPSPVDAPSDNYDVTLEDIGGNDLLVGVGADRDTATAERKTVSNSYSTEVPAHPAVSGRLWFRVANAGATNAGIAVIEFALVRQDWY